MPGLMFQLYGAVPPDAEQLTDTAFPTVDGSVAGMHDTLSWPQAAPAASAVNAIHRAVSRIISEVQS
jgi:hypothetical protein